MTTLFREHPPARPVTGFTIERYINFPADQKRPGMPGPIAPTTEAAACPQLAKADIRALNKASVFDPLQTSAVQTFCVARCLVTPRLHGSELDPSGLNNLR